MPISYSDPYSASGTPSALPVSNKGKVQQGARWWSMLAGSPAPSANPLKMDFSFKKKDRTIRAGGIEQDLERQKSLYDLYMRQASGLGPSLADMQLKQGMEDARKSASSLASSARGGNIAMAQRAAANQTATTDAQLASQAMAAKIQEQQAALGAAAGMAEAISSKELAAQQAELQAQMQAQELDLQRKAANKARFDKYFGAGLAAVSKGPGTSSG